MMQLADFENLTQYMSPNSLIFWQHSDNVQPISQIVYTPQTKDLSLNCGKKPLSLSQLSAKLQNTNSSVQLLDQTFQPIYGFRLDLEHDVPYIILK